MVGKEVLLKIDPNNLDAFQHYQNQLILKGFSQNTRRVYTSEFAQLLYTLGYTHVADRNLSKVTSPLDKLI